MLVMALKDGAREDMDLKTVDLMTESGLATIPEGVGFHAFWGPRPVAWVQSSL